MVANFVVDVLSVICVTDLLEKSAPSRIVVVASNAHSSGDISPEQFKNARHGFWAYGDSKLANIVFAKELAKRLPKGQKKFDKRYNCIIAVKGITTHKKNENNMALLHLNNQSEFYQLQQIRKRVTIFYCFNFAALSLYKPRAK